MSKRLRVPGSVFIIYLLFLAACASTKLTGVYKDRNYGGGYLKSVMIVGVSDNLKNRRLFEDTFVEQFKKTGIKAVSGVVVIQKEKKLNKETIKGAAENLGIETVLVTHLVGVEEKETYVPPSYDYMPGRHNRFGPYYSSVHQYTHTPGYYIDHKYVRLESNLYETKTEKLIWSASSETLDPKSVNVLIESLCTKVIKSLKDNNLIK